MHCTQHREKSLPEINSESEQHFKESRFYVKCCPHHRENINVEVSGDIHFLRRIGKGIDVRGRVLWT